MSGQSPPRTLRRHLAVWTAFALIPLAAFLAWVPLADNRGLFDWGGWIGPDVLDRTAPVIALLWLFGSLAIAGEHYRLFRLSAWTVAMAELATLFGLLSEPCEICSDRPAPAFPWTEMVFFLPLLWLVGLLVVAVDAVPIAQRKNPDLICDRCGANGLRYGQPCPLCGRRLGF